MNSLVGKPLDKNTLMELSLMEIQAGATIALEDQSLNQRSKQILVKIAKTAFFTQSLHNGLRVNNSSFNKYLMELLDEEHLN